MGSRGECQDLKQAGWSAHMHNPFHLLTFYLLLLLSHFSCVRLCRRQPTRLPRPWDSPGKNTGVGCHFLLQCMKVKSESKVTQSCPTLFDPMDRSLPGSSIHGIFPARVLEWVAIAFSIFICIKTLKKLLKLAICNHAKYVFMQF